MDQNNNKYNLYFYLFAALHCLIWVLVPLILRSNPHLDTLEAIGWGQEWQFGYHKHPPLSAWLIELMVVALGKKIYVTYLASQICVILSFVATWQLSRFFLLLPQRLMAVMLLEGIYYYNFTSIEFNTNVLMLAIWSWSILYCFKALNTSKLRHWIKLGILLGLAIIDKYYGLILAVTIFLMIIYENNFRKYLKTLGPYCALVSFFIVLSPHLIWLVKNNYPTLNYLASRTSSDHQFYHHLSYPILFLLAQFLACFGALIIFFTTFFKFIKRPLNVAQDFRSVFLIFMFFGPVVLTVTPSLLFGSKMKDMWGSSLWGLTGIFLFYFLKPGFNFNLFRRFLKIFLIIGGLIILIYSSSILLAKHDKRDSFNGEVAAIKVNELWLKYNKNPLKIVGGDIWLASNISFFSKQYVSVFIDMDSKISPWISDEKLKKNGGVIVWDIKTQGKELPSDYQNKTYLPITVTDSLIIESKSSKYKDQLNFELGIAIIMPNDR